jgi:Polyketide cyclase / dehydrase and lipid transport
MRVDESAPVVASAEMEIEASADAIWDVITDVERWPEWNPDVKKATLEGGPAEGATFRWKAGPGTIASTFRRLGRPRLVGWTGRTLGVRAVHVHRLEPRGDATLVTSEESWDGLPVRLFWRRMRTMLENSLLAGLGYLKAEAERRQQR